MSSFHQLCNPRSHTRSLALNNSLNDLQDIRQIGYRYLLNSET